MLAHQFQNYEIHDYKKYIETKNPIAKLVRKLWRGDSWCNYSEDGKTTIYLKPSKEKNKYKRELNDVFVAAHEACHALNYKENKTEFKTLKRLDEINLSLLLTSSILVIAFWYTIIKDEFTLQQPITFAVFALVRFIVHFSFLFVAVPYGRLHKQDEKITDQRAMNELRQHIFDNGDPITEKAERLLNKRYKERIKPIFTFKVLFPILFISVDLFLLIIMLIWGL